MQTNTHKRSRVLVVVLFAVAGCRAPSPANERPSSTVSLRKSETDAYSAFVDEFCGKWASINRAHVSSFSAYVDSIRALPAQYVESFAFRVLADQSLDRCWRTASDVIGFAGTGQDVEGLLLHLETLRPGRWTYSEPAEAWSVSLSQAISHMGLGIAAARLGEGHPTSHKIIEHLRRCSEFDYWHVPGRSPRLREEWYSGKAIDELQENLVFHEARRCVEALGATGAQTAAEHLGSLYEMAKTLPAWQDLSRNGKIPLFESVIDLNLRIRRLGLDEFVRVYGGEI